MTDYRGCLDTLVSVMREAAATEVMPRFRNTGFTVRQKTDADDLVTEADEQAEKRMTAALKALYPGALVVGEEAAGADPSLLKALPQADLAFVLDPVDGTVNFAAGIPLFAMIGAVAVRGVVVAGAVHDPVRDDVMCAVRGGGAWGVSAEGVVRALQVRGAVDAAGARGTGFWLDVDVQVRAAILARAALQPAMSVMRCSGHEYRLMASGGCDYILYATPWLKPWDHAAGLLLCREAGGYAATWDGKEWEGLEPATSMLAAGSRAQWEKLREFLIR